MNFVCPVGQCGKNCKNVGGLQSHLFHVHKIEKKKEAKQKKCRKKRTYKFKANVLRELYMARLSTTSTAEDKLEKTIAIKNGITKGMLSRYKKEANLYSVVECDPNCRKQRALSRMVSKKGKFDYCNEILFFKFCYYRKVLGYPIDNFWFRHQITKMVKEAQRDGLVTADDAAKFKASNGWLQKFLQKYGISCQMGTEKKPLHVTARLPLIQSFHQTIMSIQKSKGKLQPPHPLYGRFAPESIWNSDQIPLNFENESSKSYNQKGSSCWIRKYKTGKSKRFCSLQLTLRASGEQIVPPLVLFQGQGPRRNKDGTLRKGADIEQAELDAVKGVMWYFNPKAWANGMSARYHLRQFKAFVKAQAPEIPEHMMIFDSLNAQKTDDCIEFASELDIESIFLPGGCTDLLQPIDKHIGAWFKQQLKKLWTKFFKKKFEEDPNFEVPDHHKRVLILQWVSEIWQKLKQPQYEEFIRTTFEQPGILIQLDGKNNIKFKDYPEYELNCESIHDGVKGPSDVQ